MPTYEYICNNCQKKFSLWATFKEKEEGLDTVCPDCGSRDAKQYFGGVYFSIKGSDGSSSHSSSCTKSTCGSCKTCK